MPEPPAAPAINAFPDLIVVTAKDADYWEEACDAFAGGEYSDGDLARLYPGLTQNTACNWAVYGWPVQHELTVENHMLRIAQYIEELKAQNQLLRDLLQERQKVMDSQLEKLNDIEASNNGE